MTPNEQKEFAKELLGNFQKKIEAAVDACAIPDEWDGIELRELIYDMARDARGMSTRMFNPNSRRVRDYRNFMLLSQDLP